MDVREERLYGILEFNVMVSDRKIEREIEREIEFYEKFNIRQIFLWLNC